MLSILIILISNENVEVTLIDHKRIWFISTVIKKKLIGISRYIYLTPDKLVIKSNFDIYI